MSSRMCKQNQETSSVWGEKRASHPLAQPCMFLNQISRTCKQRCQAVLSQRLIFWEPSKRHLIFKMGWQVKKSQWVRTGGGRWRSSWLMVQWHVVAAGFMSQSKSEYWEHGRPCHARRIKNYLTMHYVGDLSRKKDERALPCGYNHNLQWSKTLPTPLYVFRQRPIDTGPLPSQ